MMHLVDMPSGKFGQDSMFGSLFLVLRAADGTGAF